jgi:hypothetical protein
MFNIPLPYQIGAVAFLVAASFGGGYLKGSAHGDLEIARASSEAQARIAELQTHQTDTNTQVITKYVDRIRTITVESNRNAQYIASLPSSSSKLSNGWVYLHDLGTTGGNAEASRATDVASSTISNSDALRTVTDNYNICRQNAEQLTALQQWIRDTQKNVEESNAK